MIFAVLGIAVHVQLFLALCYAKMFPSAVRGRIDSSSWQTFPNLLIRLRR